MDMAEGEAKAMGFAMGLMLLANTSDPTYFSISLHFHNSNTDGEVLLS